MIVERAARARGALQIGFDTEPKISQGRLPSARFAVDLPCKLYLTHRSEYLVLHDLCVGVRDRVSGRWVPLHSGACAHVLGPLTATETRMLPATRIRVGEQLCLSAPARRVVTGPIVAIEKATPELIDQAERRWRDLFGSEDPRDSILLLER
jgi:hypothetical protein